MKAQRSAGGEATETDQRHPPSVVRRQVWRRPYRTGSRSLGIAEAHGFLRQFPEPLLSARSRDEALDPITVGSPRMYSNPDGPQ